MRSECDSVREVSLTVFVFLQKLTEAFLWMEMESRSLLDSWMTRFVPASDPFVDVPTIGFSLFTWMVVYLLVLVRQLSDLIFQINTILCLIPESVLFRLKKLLATRNTRWNKLLHFTFKMFPQEKIYKQFISPLIHWAVEFYEYFYLPKCTLRPWALVITNTVLFRFVDILVFWLMKNY